MAAPETPGFLRYGLRLEALKSIVERMIAEGELMADEQGQLEGFLASFTLFVQQSPAWRRYLAEAAGPALSPEDEEATAAAAETVLNQVSDDALFGPDVRAVAQAEAEELRDDEGRVRRGPAQATRDTLHNLLIAIGRLALKGARQAKSIAGDTYKTAKKALTTAVGTAAGLEAAAFLAKLPSPLRLLSERLPQDFGWLETLLKSLGL